MSRKYSMHFFGNGMEPPHTLFWMALNSRAVSSLRTNARLSRCFSGISKMTIVCIGPLFADGYDSRRSIPFNNLFASMAPFFIIRHAPDSSLVTSPSRCKRISACWNCFSSSPDFIVKWRFFRIYSFAQAIIIRDPARPSLIAIRVIKTMHATDMIFSLFLIYIIILHFMTIVIK